VAYYVIGGEYTDTSFEELVRPEPVLGPFETYAQAYIVWRGRAMATIDQAYTRFDIVECEEPPRPGEVLPRRERRAS
jgi:hypothetical protein